MSKFFVLVAFVGMVSAGRIQQRESQRDINTAGKRVERMSWQDLVRQKFLLDIVHRVQEPLQQEDLIQLDQGLITDENRYRFGIDGEIELIIDLDRQRRLLNQHQVYNIRNEDHVLQLRGIIRILASSKDFETLQRNAIYLRRNINPVLFVHGLSLAIRNHPDTQELIMPGMQEILPDLYLDQEMMQRIQRVQLEHRALPSVMSLVGRVKSSRGVNPLMDTIIPSRLALKAQQIRENTERIVLPMPTENQGISLLTEDIDMRIFVQNLVSNLALNEDTTENRLRNLQRMGNINDMELEMEQRRRQQENVEDNMDRNQRDRFAGALRRKEINNEQSQSRAQNSGRRPSLENIGRMTSRITDGDDLLPTVDIKDDRLLHVGRRRQNLNSSGSQEKQLETRLREGRQNMWNMNDNVEDLIDNLPTIRRDNERLVQINRRRLDQTAANRTPRRMMKEDTMQLISREPTEEMLRRNRQREEQTELERFISMIREERLGEERRVDQWQQRQDNDQGWIDNLQQSIDYEQVTRRSEVLAHTLRQLLARLNQERISLRLGNEEMQLMDNSRLILANQNQAQRYALRLNEMLLDSRRNRALLDQINAIEVTLRQVIDNLIRERNSLVTDSALNPLDESLRLERMIGEILTGRLGDTGIMRILRAQLQDTNVMQMDSLGLGVSLNNRVLQYTLRRILDVVDKQREQQLGAYRREQLHMQGVTINDMRVSKLSTFIEEVDMDVSSLLEQPQKMQLVVSQRRLNNLPFTIDLDIHSEREEDVIIRMLLGPRQDAEGRDLSLEQRRNDFVLLDAINTQLQSGINRIQHRSTCIGWTTRNVTPYSEIYRRVMTTMRGQQEQLISDELVAQNGRFPQRLLLPRGRPEGLPMQLLVIVSPIERQEHRMVLDRTGGLMISQASIEDKRPLGFPLDRRIDNEQKFIRLSNVQLQDVVIVHEN
ncbi:fat-body protein 1 [Drosophila innubila]|uniref:fat-body protein 1 n=1 Tax=Drosophila innubila TaxID=198719 RepID=UPI00148BBC85|nr:fat-body protein 1 [Drosophila innubila]